MSREPVETWQGCYDGNWNGLIVPESFAHPAKFARGLIERIFDEGLRRGWWEPGAIVGDPFGGVALGGIIAAYRGLRWAGVELEARFVDLGNQNIELHRAKLEALGAPVPVLVQGDSRAFASIVGPLAGIVGSPPYISGGHHPDQTGSWGGQAQANTKEQANYGTTPGQIGRLPAGELGAVVSSPPYAESIQGEHAEKETASESRDKRRTPGGSLGQSQRHGGYGSTPGNIGNLAEGKLHSVVTSPPWAENPEAPPLPPERIRQTSDPQQHGAAGPQYISGSSEGQLGNASGETYWAAVAQVYEQCRIALRPGGYMVLVVKNYVKAKAIVPLCDQTHELLLHLGFEPVTRIRAMLVKEHRTPGLFGEKVQRKERKSFFRRLAEAKGSPRIDYEEVLVVRKP